MKKRIINWLSNPDHLEMAIVTGLTLITILSTASIFMIAFHIMIVGGN